jgi:hypothetical protein
MKSKTQKTPEKVLSRLQKAKNFTECKAARSKLHFLFSASFLVDSSDCTLIVSATFSCFKAAKKAGWYPMSFLEEFDIATMENSPQHKKQLPKH